MSVPDELRYTTDHEWVMGSDSPFTIGVTQYAVDQLGDAVFLELPEVGAAIEAGKPFGEVESVKAVSDLYAPISGEVVEVNEAAVDEPVSINEDPYASWLLRVKASEAEPLKDLMTPETYKQLIGDA